MRARRGLARPASRSSENALALLGCGFEELPQGGSEGPQRGEPRRASGRKSLRPCGFAAASPVVLAATARGCPGGPSSPALGVTASRSLSSQPGSPQFRWPIDALPQSRSPAGGQPCLLRDCPGAPGTLTLARASSVRPGWLVSSLGGDPQTRTLFIVASEYVILSKSEFVSCRLKLLRPGLPVMMG